MNQRGTLIRRDRKDPISAFLTPLEIGARVAGLAALHFAFKFLKNISVHREKSRIKKNDESPILTNVQSSDPPPNKRVDAPLSMASTDGDIGIKELSFDMAEEILDYWFANPPSKSNSKLWMIPNERNLTRRRIDADITEKFGTFVERISSNFEQFLSGVAKTRSSMLSFHWKVAAIIAMDQMSRHIYRYFEETYIHNMDLVDEIPPRQLTLNQNEMDTLAVKLSSLILEDHKNLIDNGRIPLPMHVFILMPYRHESKIESLQFVQNCINNRVETEEENGILLKRFRNATNRRLTRLQDVARKAGGESKEIGKMQFEDILEVLPFESDMAGVNSHPALLTISKFLEARGMNKVKTQKSLKTEVKSIELNQRFPLIVSLSGGVDSMVIASVLAYLQDIYNLKIIAVHIDYANRPESSLEAKYVEEFCEKLKIEFRCRVINEVTRGVTARDEYEKVARIARYDIYKATQTEFQVGGIKPPVFLGHHKGDLRENVLSNSMKGCGPLELSGMTDEGIVEQVLVYRPLLPLEKEVIYDYAHKYGVPYFKDTTPLWSTRGKLRNSLLPLLCDIYGEGSMGNLSNLAIQSDAAKDLFVSSQKSFFDSVQIYPMGLSFDASNHKNHNLFFWRFVIRKILHENGLGMFTDKSVNSFIKRISANPHKLGWLQCRKDYAVYLGENFHVYVMHPESFPWSKTDQYSCKNMMVRIDDNVCEIGPWLIRVTSEERADETILHTKPFLDMKDFMRGNFKYYLEVPTDCSKLAVTEGQFNKSNRPLGWKNCDLKIESTLPLIGRPDKNEDDSQVSIVKVEYILKSLFEESRAQNALNEMSGGFLSLQVKGDNDQQCTIL